MLVRYGVARMDIKSNVRFRGATLALAGIGCVLVSAASASPASGATSRELSGSAKQIVKAAIDSASKAGSVRVTVQFFSGKTTGELVQDSARRSAVQTVAIGKERVSILLSDGTVYFSGNDQGLAHYFGLDKSAASTLAGRWISASPKDSAFQSLTAGLTLSSALKEVTPTGSMVRGKSKIVRGQSTASVSGTGPAGVARVTLFVAAKGRPLPIEAVSSGGTESEASGEIVSFSRWGESVKVPTPSSSIPISTLSAGTPVGG